MLCTLLEKTHIALGKVSKKKTIESVIMIIAGGGGCSNARLQVKAPFISFCNDDQR